MLLIRSSMVAKRQTLIKPLTHLLGLNHDLRPAYKASAVTLSCQLQPERFARNTHPARNVSSLLQTVALLLSKHKAISALGKPCRNNTSKRTCIHTSKRCAITKPSTGKLLVNQGDPNSRPVATTDGVHPNLALYHLLKVEPSTIPACEATPTKVNDNQREHRFY